MFEAETEGLLVRASPQFLEHGSDAAMGRFVWAYTIELHNLSNRTLQLINRHWVITDAHGLVQEVRGTGVVGKQPILKPGETFSYTSSAAIPTSMGMMVGSFEIRAEDGDVFEAAVPAFPLESPGAAKTLH